MLNFPQLSIGIVVLLVGLTHRLLPLTLLQLPLPLMLALLLLLLGEFLCLDGLLFVLDDQSLNLLKVLGLLSVKFNSLFVCEVSGLDLLNLVDTHLEVFKKLWLDVAISLFHYVFVKELCFDLLNTLNVGICDLTVFV